MDLCDAYLRRIDAQLPGEVTAAWLGGSVALGDYHAGVSDLDLFLVTRRALTLQERHRAAPSWCSPLQVEWLVEGDLAGYAQQGDLAAISTATLHRHGLTLRGPTPAAVLPDVSQTQLASCTLSNLLSYWVPWLKQAQTKTIPHLIALHPKRIQWGVFGVPRQYATIATGEILSKSAGARYVRERFERRWHRVIDEALRLREQRRGSLYSSWWIRRQEMLDFLGYAIERALTLAW